MGGRACQAELLIYVTLLKRIYITIIHKYTVGVDVYGLRFTVNCTSLAAYSGE